MKDFFKNMAEALSAKNKVNNIILIEMKETFFTFFLAACLLAACSGTGGKSGQNADNSADSSNAVIAFNEYEFDFGKVKQGKKVRHTFTFENEGEGNLVIHSATTTCGCTVPKYDRKPIAPKKTGKLEVEFDTSGRDGLQTKAITIKSNATMPVVILKITADVTQ